MVSGGNMIDNEALSALIKAAVTKSFERWERDRRAGERSQPFLRELAVQLEGITQFMEPGIQCVGLARGHDTDRHKKWFGLTEMLWDVAVLRVEPFVSGSKERRRVLSGVWAVESELVNNFTAVLVDANKLMLARTTHRLLVAREVQIAKYAGDLSAWSRGAGVDLWTASVDWPKTRDSGRVTIGFCSGSAPGA